MPIPWLQWLLVAVGVVMSGELLVGCVHCYCGRGCRTGDVDSPAAFIQCSSEDTVWQYSNVTDDIVTCWTGGWL